VVPQAHRGLLRNVKDLTEPTANIEVGSAILYGYMRSANGDLNTALKSYGGSQAYAQKVSLRVEDFASAVASQDAGAHPDAHNDTCEGDHCAASATWANAFSVTAGNGAAVRGAASAGLSAAAR
jgi:hypothetical protein